MKYITKGQWNIVKADAIEAVNEHNMSHRRVRAKVYFSKIEHGINKCEYVDARMLESVKYVYCRTVNFGTKRWPDWINTVEEFDARDIIKETDKTYRLSYGNSYLLKNNVMAIVVDYDPVMDEGDDDVETM